MSSLQVVKCDICFRIQEMRDMGTGSYSRMPEGWATINATVHMHGKRVPYDPKNPGPWEEANARKKNLKKDWPKMHICHECVAGRVVGQLKLVAPERAVT